MEIFDLNIDGIYTVLSRFLKNYEKAQLAVVSRRFMLACSEKYVYQLDVININEAHKFPNLLELNIWGNELVDCSPLGTLVKFTTFRY